MEGVKHWFKSVVPPDPPIDMSSVEEHGIRSCLKCSRDQLDPEHGYVYFPISDEERRLGSKE